MCYELADFAPFSSDSGRLAANPEAACEQWLDARQQLVELPVSMYRQAKTGSDYLTAEQCSSDSGTRTGARSPETETRLAEFTQDKAASKKRVADADTMIAGGPAKPVSRRPLDREQRRG